MFKQDIIHITVKEMNEECGRHLADMLEVRGAFADSAIVRIFKRHPVDKVQRKGR